MGTLLNKAYRDKQIDATESEDGQVTEITERWFVNTNFGADADAALAATDLPANAAAHPIYTDLKVTARDPSLDSSGQKWFVDVTYSIIQDEDEDGQKLINITYGTHELQQDVTHNLGTGAILVDGNGKPFTQTIQVPRAYPFISINKKQRTAERDEVLELSGTINDASVVVAGVTIPQYAGRIMITATETEDEEFPWEISYEVMVRYFTLSNYIDFAGTLQAGPTEVGWNEGVINEGFYVNYVPGSGIPGPSRAVEVVILDDGTKEERPSATPILLDENGQKLDEGATPISILLQVYPDGDWSGLPLNVT